MHEIRSVETERSLLGSILMAADEVMPDVITYIGEQIDVFTEAENRELYQAILELYKANKPIDSVTILSASSKISASFMSELIADHKSTYFSAQYAEDLRGLADLRNVNALCRATQSELEHTRDYKKFIDQFESNVFELTKTKPGESIQHIKPTASDEARRLIAILKGKREEGIPTGYSSLDKYFNGFLPGAVTTIAARPSVGKTALALNLAHTIAKAGHGVLFFSLEMARSELVRRLFFLESGIGYGNIKEVWPSSESIEAKIQLAEKRLEELPLYIDDSPALTPLELRAKSRRQLVRDKIEVIFVDYLQLMSSPGRHNNRENEVSIISRMLKATAKELGVSLVSLSQLNRQNIETEPVLSNLRESGSIEQDSDNVMLMWPSDSNDGVGVKLAKQRSGPTCKTVLQFDKSLQCFRDEN